MRISRRSVLGAAVGLGVGSALARSIAKASAPEAGIEQRRIRLAVSTYSYWHFRGPKFPIEKVIEHAGALGFDGVEILHRQMENESLEYCNRLKRLAFSEGLDLVMLSIHQDFVDPDADARRRAVEHTRHCISLAERLGIPCIRLNSGRWGTIRSFDDLMKARGVEPPLEGHTEGDAFRWCVDAIHECLSAAEKAGVVLALENHWGLTRRAEGLLRIYHAVHSPWLGINLDTGNFLDDTYRQFERVAPHASIIQAKTYFGGGEWYTLDLDYPRLAAILRRAGFRGYVSLEMEGKERALTAVPKSLAMLREAFQ